jgi:hypothetical protein
MSLATHSNKNGAMLRRSIDRFWLKVIVPEDRRQCFEWTGYRDKDGYGRHRPGTGKNYVGAHRFAWQLAGGEIPKGLHVLHRCDNRGCVNPLHLFVGTNRENVDDMLRKERQNRGSIHPRAILTEAMVREIKTLLVDHVSEREIAKRYGCTRGAITAIARGLTWKHITPHDQEAG